MSEKHNPNEPLIIKSDRPHEVTMPQGTNVAVGKKGEEGAPAVRKVLADPTGLCSAICAANSAQPRGSLFWNCTRVGPMVYLRAASTGPAW